MAATMLITAKATMISISENPPGVTKGELGLPPRIGADNTSALTPCQGTRVLIFNERKNEAEVKNQ